MRRPSIALLLFPIIPILVLGAMLSMRTDWRASAKLTAKVANAVEWAGGSAVPIACKRLDDGYELLLLTARHVVEPFDLSFWFASQGNDRYYGNVKLVSYHPSEDAALLRVRLFDGDPCDVVPLRADHPPFGEDVWAIGYPAVGRRSVTHGYVGDFRCASADVFPGCSGGPVLDCYGRLVGIVVAVGMHKAVDDPHYVHHDMIFVPTGSLIEWLTPYL